MSGKENNYGIRRAENRNRGTAREEPKLPSEKVIFYNDLFEYEIESKYYLNGPMSNLFKQSEKNKVNFYFKNMTFKIKKIQIPSWINRSSMQAIHFYLKHQKLQMVSSDELQEMSNLLKTSDVFGLYKFQEEYVKNVVLLNITSQNCLQFLHESFLKLKESETCSNSWYLIFNHCLSVASKYLEEILAVNGNGLFQLNKKIIGEIIQRFLKQNLNFTVTDERFYELLLFSQEFKEMYQLLDNERKGLTSDSLMFRKILLFESDF